jgi:hypothetical protein
MSANKIQRLKTRRALHVAFDGKCFYCGTRLAWEGPPNHKGRQWLEVGVSTAMDIEHKVPIIRGGDHSVANVVASCKSCNAEKRLRTAEEYRLLLGLRRRAMPHRFAGEAPPPKRDYLVVVSPEAILALVAHNRTTRRSRSRWDAHGLRKTALR